MTKNNLLSIILVAILLAFALTTQTESEKSDANTSDYKISATSIVANIPKNLPGPIIAAEKEEIILDIDAAIGLLKELNNERILFSHDAHKQWPLASLTKLMTAVIAIESSNFNTVIPISEKAVASEGPQGGFKAGEMFMLEDLIKALMTVSSNDAAAAIGEFFGQENFVRLMNEKAKQLKMENTFYVEPTGLSLSNQSNVFDLEKLMQYIYNHHPEILAFSRQKSVDIFDLRSNTKRTLLNINTFAGQQDFIGGKTGYLDEANGNLVSLFSKNGRPILIVVLGADNRFKETEKIWQYYKQSAF